MVFIFYFGSFLFPTFCVCVFFPFIRSFCYCNLHSIMLSFRSNGKKTLLFSYKENFPEAVFAFFFFFFENLKKRRIFPFFPPSLPWNEGKQISFKSFLFYLFLFHNKEEKETNRILSFFLFEIIEKERKKIKEINRSYSKIICKLKQFILNMGAMIEKSLSPIRDERVSDGRRRWLFLVRQIQRSKGRWDC